jgi:hypothetical protein
VPTPNFRPIFYDAHTLLAKALDPLFQLGLSQFFREGTFRVLLASAFLFAI